jgi:hypothetical protein
VVIHWLFNRYPPYKFRITRDCRDSRSLRFIAMDESL